jgi:AraC-like DNA-binding protein
MAACNLLSTTDWPAARIASRCGYSDHSHLTHELNRAHGVSPRKYRQQFRVESFDSNLKLPVLSLD